VRYLLYGYYGYGNFGDDILLQAMIGSIRARDAAAGFIVHSFDPVPGYAGDPDVQFVALARCLQNARKRPWQIVTYLRGFARAVGHSDVLVIGGGTLFVDKGRFNLSLALLYLGVLMARAMGKRVVVVGVGIDRLGHPTSRWLTRRILGAASFVAVREALALPYVDHRPADSTKLAADLVLALALGPPPVRAPRVRPVVGVCFIDYFRTIEPSEVNHKAYEAAIFRLVESHRTSRDFACITLQRGVGQRDDWLVPRWHERFPDFRVIGVDGIDAARDMAAAIDVLVTTRFHLGILGVMWEKPVVVIDHELKMASLATDFALPAISLAEFVTARDLELDSLLADYDPPRTADRLAVQRERVALNFAWLPAGRPTG
jgi:polysaccharide pyruvyl transferase WcaK-like protein